MIKEFNVLITGVGGQGVILMSELLGKAAVSDGLRVRGSEVLGMAVRGGPVISTIRIGSEVYGPLIPAGKGDLIIGMEPAETLRNITYMSKSSLIILNTQRVVPVMVFLGKSSYPSLDEILEKLKSNSDRVIKLDAVQLAEEAGSALSANMVMLGASFGTGRLPIKIETIKKTMEAHFSAKIAPVNIRAFDLGYQTCQRLLSKV